MRYSTTSVLLFYYLMAWKYIGSAQFCKQNKPVSSRRKSANVQYSMVSVYQHLSALQELFLKHPNQFTLSKIIQQQPLTTPPHNQKVLFYFDMSNVKIDTADVISLGICTVHYCKLLSDLIGENREKNNPPQTAWCFKIQWQDSSTWNKGKKNPHTAALFPFP